MLFLPLYTQLNHSVVISGESQGLVHCIRSYLCEHAVHVGTSSYNRHYLFVCGNFPGCAPVSPIASPAFYLGPQSYKKVVGGRSVLP